MALAGVRSVGAARGAARRLNSSNAVAPAKSSAPAKTTAPAAKPAPAYVPREAKSKGGVWSRFTAFLTGIAVGGAGSFYYIHDEIWKSTVQLERGVFNLKGDIVDTNRELRERVATLEHEIVQMKNSRA